METLMDLMAIAEDAPVPDRLERIADVVRDHPKRWRQNRFYDADEPEFATGTCLVGLAAIAARHADIIDFENDKPVYGTLKESIRYEDPVEWNDDRNRTASDVENALREIAPIIRQKEQE